MLLQCLNNAESLLLAYQTVGDVYTSQSVLRDYWTQSLSWSNVTVFINTDVRFRKKSLKIQTYSILYCLFFHTLTCQQAQRLCAMLPPRVPKWIFKCSRRKLIIRMFCKLCHDFGRGKISSFKMLDLNCSKIIIHEDRVKRQPPKERGCLNL